MEYPGENFQVDERYPKDGIQVNEGLSGGFQVDEGNQVDEEYLGKGFQVDEEYPKAGIQIVDKGYPG